MSATDTIDVGRISLAGTKLRLPALKLMWPDLGARADKKGWPAARFLGALAEHEMVEPANRRIRRLSRRPGCRPARPPTASTLTPCRWSARPRSWYSRRQLDQGRRQPDGFRPARTGKSHLAAALGYALVDNGYRVLFDLIQKLQVARRDLQLEAAIARLDKYHLLILDDIAYVTKAQAETSVTCELTAARCERRSMFITANQPFGEWGRIFPK